MSRCISRILGSSSLSSIRSSSCSSSSPSLSSSSSFSSLCSLSSFSSSSSAFSSASPVFSSFSRSFSSGIVQHRPSSSNPQGVPWSFSPSNQARVAQILAKFPSNYRSSAVMPLLTLAQEQNDNWLPIAAMDHVASLLQMAPMRVYEVATFYSMYNREPLGRYHIQLCGTTPCMLCGAEKLADTLERHLGVAAGETTKDGLFTWTEVECLGACANAPMIQVNNHEFYENLTPDTLMKLIDDMREGKKVKVGPQNGQKVAEGIQGKTTLKDPSSIKNVCRDLDEVAKQWAAEQEKAKAAAAAAAAGAPKK